MDNNEIRQLSKDLPRLASFLRTQRGKIAEETITEHLLTSIETQAISAIVLSIWLSVTKSPSLIARCLKTTFSLRVRIVAIKQFEKQWRGRHWRAAVDALDGIQGMLTYLSELSVVEVRRFVRALGRGASSGPNKLERREIVTQLYQSLHPEQYPDAEYKSPDTRDLTAQYASLLPAVSERFLESHIHSNAGCVGKLNHRDRERLVHSNPELMQRVVEEYMLSPRELDEPHLWIASLLRAPLPVHDAATGLSKPTLDLMHLAQNLVRARQTFSSSSLVTYLFEPLLEKLSLRRRARGQVGTISQCAVTYLEQRPKMRTDLSYHDTRKNSLLALVISAWGKNPTMYEELLRRLLLLIEDTLKQSDLLRLVPRNLRYKLYRLIVLCNPHRPLDLESADDLKTLGDKSWYVGIFLDMQQDESTALLERLLAAHGDINLVVPSLEHDRDSFALDFYRWGQPGHRLDPNLLLCMMKRGTAGADKLARSLVNEHRTRASMGRDHEIRADEAKSAIRLAGASGSIELLGDTLRWARRFTRDPLTMKEILHLDNLLANSVCDVLAGLPRSTDRSLMLMHEGYPIADKGVKDRIINANNVLSELLETATLAIREPSFSSWDWTDALRSIAFATEIRIATSQTLQTALNLSDNEVYDVIYDSTIKMLLNVERTTVDPANDALDFNEAFGPAYPLGAFVSPPFYRFGDDMKPSVARSTFTFIDKLAKERDSLWQQYRLSLEPAVASLPAPWPRGLPLRALTMHFDITVPEARDCTPYLLSRAESIVFADSDAMLRPSFIDEDDDQDKAEELRRAAGRFVDNYTHAFRIYVLQGLSESARVQRCTAALDHALSHFNRWEKKTGITSLAEPLASADFRLLQEQLLAYEDQLKEIIVKALGLPESQILPGSLHRNYPLLPDNLDPATQNEWDPEELKPSDVKAKPTQRLVFDYFLDQTYAPHSNFCARDSPVQPVTEHPGLYYPSIFSTVGSKDTANLVYEAQVIAALLYLDSKGTKSSRILSSAFPSKEDVRYAPLFLSFDFLEELAQYPRSPSQVPFYVKRALDVLRKPSHLLIAPPKLIHELCMSTWHELESLPEADAGYGQCEIVFHKLLICLANSDSPGLATELILKTVLQRPNASSWHRMLLSLSFLRKLSSNQVQDLMTRFASEICIKLEAQTEAKRQRERGQQAAKSMDVTVDTDNGKGPLIKVTTVKYLAQILNNADYVSPKFSIHLLERLLEKASHIDIRAAVVDSLLNILDGCKTDEEHHQRLSEAIFDALKPAVHVAGSLNERWLLSEEEWRHAEATHDLPEIYQGGSPSCPPIANALISFLHRATFKHAPKVQEQCFQRLILPMLEQSQQNHQRWLRILATRTRLSAISAAFPPLPVKPKMLSQILEGTPAGIPSSLLQLQHNFVMFRLNPPSEICVAAAKIFNDSALRNSPVGAHFLSLVPADIRAVSTSVFAIPRLLFCNTSFSDLDTTAAFQLIQKLAFEQAKTAILTISDERFETWNALVKHIEQSFGNLQKSHPTPFMTTEVQKTVFEYGIPWLESVLKFIDDLRMSSTWQTNSHRTPTVLPSTLSLRTYTSLQKIMLNPQISRTTRRNDLLTLLSRLVDQISTDPSLHNHVSLLAQTASHIPAEDKVYHAYRLCKDINTTRSPLETTEYHKADVAVELMKHATYPEEKAEMESVIEMLRAWRASRDETLRMIAWGMRRWAMNRKEERDEHAWVAERILGAFS